MPHGTCSFHFDRPLPDVKGIASFARIAQDLARELPSEIPAIATSFLHIFLRLDTIVVGKAGSRRSIGIARDGHILSFWCEHVLLAARGAVFELPMSLAC
jgi:hypothetical protein